VGEKVFMHGTSAGICRSAVRSILTYATEARSVILRTSQILEKNEMEILVVFHPDCGDFR
jgi:hypothetical protein